MVSRFLAWVAGMIGMTSDTVSAPQTFDEVVIEVLAKLEDLERRQARVLAVLEDAVASDRSLDEIRRSIDEI